MVTMVKEVTVYMHEEYNNITYLSCKDVIQVGNVNLQLVRGF